MHYSDAGELAIGDGKEVWEEFCSCTGIRHATTRRAVLFDLHNVINTMNHEEAARTGVELDYLENTVTLACSYGHRNRQGMFNRNAEWCPMIAECDGHIFTDFREGWYSTVDIYRNDWMNKTCIAVTGDKGQVAKLLEMPCLLFDDKEDNIRTVWKRSTWENPLSGVVVRRGRKARWPVEPGFFYSNDCADWLGIIKNFAEDPWRPLSVHWPRPGRAG